MAYLALYRQYRPRTFDQVLGQEAIVRTLTNQVTASRVAHAYLFCGTRGTGKTSTAKVLARAVNCLDPRNGNPCGQCAVCRMSDEALSVDIVEIDAASNNGVDQIRELRDQVQFAPSMLKTKVYIIDEVHMLSGAAFNALLKTLEEPPSHVLFILATTEAHKLPATIVSRCQRFDFRRIPENVILGQLRYILSQIGREADEEALELIARTAEGGLRDALSLLDQCLELDDGRLTEAVAIAGLGAVGGADVQAMIDALLQFDRLQALEIADRVYRGGSDMAVFARACMQHTRDRLVSGGNTAALSRIMDELMEAENRMAFSPRPRILMDAALVRLCTPELEQGDAALIVGFAPADVHPDGVLLQRFLYILAPLHGAHTAPGQIVLPADVEQLIGRAQAVHIKMKQRQTSPRKTPGEGGFSRSQVAGKGNDRTGHERVGQGTAQSLCFLCSVCDVFLGHVQPPFTKNFHSRLGL